MQNRPQGPLRVLHVTSSYPRHLDDACAPFLADLVKVQSDAGMDVCVLAPHDAGLATREHLGPAAVRRFRYAPDRLERLAYRGGLLAMARSPLGAALVVPYLVATIRCAVSYVREVRPDVIHAHWWFPSGLAAVIAGAVHRVPVVVSIHGTDLTLGRIPGLGMLGRWVLRRAAVVAATSDTAAADVAAVFGRNAVVLPLPVTLAATPTPYVPDPTRPLRLVAAGRFVPEKGFDVLIEAMKICEGRCVDVELTLIGHGPAGPALRAAAGANVTFWAPGARQTLHEAVLAADALVMPSLREGYGMMAAEAAALGRPVVASAVGGLIEIVEPGRNGLLVTPSDPVALADAIAALPLATQVVPDLTRTPSAVASAHWDAYLR